ncbi:hypothetical protein CC99x_002965 [Candidatus Berkiella cookevillensis]|uniref:Poly-beta-hydroxybutyrate polymerase n=1 Tax=Candidatus Berkiella cookevillensis TaxID=437022 RepID=A0A0Q9YP58_9GAMM|nr:alpha/beta hydrolase [Candidatus Berkiella cookevillensis]MCS5707858.1 hypothetical protein [Candidatus Berkiella cookevillensis]
MIRHKIAQAKGFDLYYYPSQKLELDLPPILITFALVNSPTILDISPERSFINHLLNLGFSIYLIEWCVPTHSDHSKSLDDYIMGDIHSAVENVYVREGKKLLLMGICQGGYFNLCYALRRSERLCGIILLVTPIDFHVPGNRIYQMIKYMNLDDIEKRMINVPGWCINQAIFSVSPFLFSLKKIKLLKEVGKETGLTSESELIKKVEAWAWDCPPQAGKAFFQFTKNCIQENALVNQGLVIDGKLLKLQSLRIPVLNIYAVHDPIWPMACAAALSHHIPPSLYQGIKHPGGHIGVMMGRAGLAVLPRNIYDWAHAHSEICL